MIVKHLQPGTGPKPGSVTAPDRILRPTTSDPMTTDLLLNPKNIQSLLRIYHDGLLHDTLPFWLPRAIDKEHGGYITALGEDGTVLQTDKAVWFQGRFAWLLATLYNT